MLLQTVVTVVAVEAAVVLMAQALWQLLMLFVVLVRVEVVSGCIAKRMAQFSPFGTVAGAAVSGHLGP